MYAIISQGKIVSLCDKPRYVRRNESGIYVEAIPEKAIAVSVNGDLYNINGNDAVPGAPEAVVKEEDGAEYIFKTKEQAEKSNDKNSANIDYLSMMVGVDLPEEVNANEPEV